MEFIEKTQEELSRMTAKERREYNVQLRAYKSRETFERAAEEDLVEREIPKPVIQAAPEVPKTSEIKEAPAKPKATVKEVKVKNARNAGRKKTKEGEYTKIHVDVPVEVHKKLIELAEEQCGGNLTKYINRILDAHLKNIK